MKTKQAAIDGACDDFMTESITGFVLAGDLEVGTTLIDNEGNEHHLLIKRWEQLHSPILVYNFAFEDYHTYFVGRTKVLVHNMCSSTPS